VSRLEELGLARLIEMHGVIRINLGESQQQDGSDAGENRVGLAEGCSDSVRPNRGRPWRDTRGLVVAPGREIEPLAVETQLLGLYYVVR